jgi:hypothetical protein
LIAVANIALLTLMLVIWTDDLELLFNGSVRFNEFVRIIGFTFLALIGMRILVSYFRKKGIYEVRKKIKYAVILTLLICSFLYVPYSINILNRLINANTRQHILTKMENNYSPKVDNLSLEEYKEIGRMIWFPKIPESAENISVGFYQDGFLPDFTVDVNYEVPMDEKITELDSKNGQYSKTISVKIIGNRKKVYYHEGQY